MNKLDHVMNNNLKDINQANYAIEHEIEIDITSNLSICPKSLFISSNCLYNSRKEL